MLEQAVDQKDTELRSAAASQREAGEALRRSGARAQRLEQDVAQLQARNLELQRAQDAAEALEFDTLQQLRQQVLCFPYPVLVYWIVDVLTVLCKAHILLPRSTCWVP